MVEEVEGIPIDYDYVLKATKDIKRGETVGAVDFSKLPPTVTWINEYFEIKPIKEE